MLIIILILVSLFFFFSNALPYYLLIKKITLKHYTGIIKTPLAISPIPLIILGYILINIQFFFFHQFFGGAQNSVKIILSYLVFIIPASLLFRRALNVKIFKQLFSDKQDFYLIPIIIFLVIFIAWPFMASESGYYLHTSNEDTYDGMNGALAYINLNFDQIVDGFKTHIRFQYSSIALCTLLTGKENFDPTIIHSILNLLMTSMGVFWLCKNVLKVPIIPTIISSVLSVISIFYFNTYLTGHIGSAIYASCAPIYLGLLILCFTRRISWYWLIPIAIIRYFSELTYPGVIPIIEAPFLGYLFLEYFILPLKIFTKAKRFYFTNQKLSHSVFKILATTLLFTIATTIFLIIVWNHYATGRAAEHIRIITNDISWLIAGEKEIIPIFWGLFQPDLTGTPRYLPFLVKNPYLYYPGFVISFMGLVFFYIGGLKTFNTKEQRYLFAYTLTYPIMVLIFRFMIKSTYYFYKFLYVNYFLITIIIVIGFYHCIKKRSLKTKMLSYLIAILLLTPNIFWSITHSVLIYQRPYNNSVEIIQFEQFIKKNKLKNINNICLIEDNYLALSNILKRNKIKKCLKNSDTVVAFFANDKINFKDQLTKDETIFKNKSITLVKLDKRSSQCTTNYYDYMSQTTGPISILWTKSPPKENEPNIKYNKWFKVFSLKINKINKDHRFINILLASGPSIDFKTFPIKVSINKKEVLRIKTDENLTKISIPIPLLKNNKDLDLLIESKGFTTKSLLPVNPERLSVGLVAIETSDLPSDQSEFLGYSKANATPAIIALRYKNQTISRLLKAIAINTRSKSKTAILIIRNKTNIHAKLLKGWFPIEIDSSSQPYRQLMKSAAISIDNKGKYNSLTIMITASSFTNNNTNVDLLIKTKYNQFLHTIKNKHKIKIKLTEKDLQDEKVNIQILSKENRIIKIHSISISK